MDKLDKNKESNVYTVQIKNNKEYQGRYLIFIEYEDTDKIKLYKRSKLFKVKLTKNKECPKTLKDINEAEYIKLFDIPYELRILPISGNMTYDETEKEYKDKTKPDKYNYLYIYYLELKISKKDFENFEYIGKYRIKDDTKNEYSVCKYTGPRLMQIEDYEDKILHAYNCYNLKEDLAYTEEGIKRINEYVKLLVDSLNKSFEEIMSELNGEINYNPGWGPKLYDYDLPCNLKDSYNKIYSNNKNIEDAKKEFYNKWKEEMQDKLDGPRFWMVYADLEMKHNRLTKNIKKDALEAIKIDLTYWENTNSYEERKKELDKLKKRLEEYKTEE